MTLEVFEFLFDVLDGEKCSLSCRELLGRIGRHLFLSPGFGFAFFLFNISLFPIFPGLSELIFSQFLCWRSNFSQFFVSNNALFLVVFQIMAQGDLFGHGNPFLHLHKHTSLKIPNDWQIRIRWMKTKIFLKTCKRLMICLWKNVALNGGQLKSFSEINHPVSESTLIFWRLHL